MFPGEGLAGGIEGWFRRNANGSFTVRKGVSLPPPPPHLSHHLLSISLVRARILFQHPPPSLSRSHSLVLGAHDPLSLVLGAHDPLVPGDKWF